MSNIANIIQNEFWSTMKNHPIFIKQLESDIKELDRVSERYIRCENKLSNISADIFGMSEEFKAGIEEDILISLSAIAPSDIDIKKVALLSVPRSLRALCGAIYWANNSKEGMSQEEMHNHFYSHVLVRLVGEHEKFGNFLIKTFGIPPSVTSEVFLKTNSWDDRNTSLIIGCFKMFAVDTGILTAEEALNELSMELFDKRHAEFFTYTLKLHVASEVDREMEHEKSQSSQQKDTRH